MTAKVPPDTVARWEPLLVVFAKAIEEIAGKLTEDQLCRLAAVGSSIYQRWCQHTEAERQAAQALLRSLGP